MFSCLSYEYIADYYENLYQAREGKIEYQQWTNKIQSKVKEIEEDLATKPPVEKFSKKEMNTTIQHLKRNKANGPDNIPNELFKEADYSTKRIVLDSMKRIAIEQNIPAQWQVGNILRLYKGKGVKGKCSNERGITLASNMGKVFERMVNERAKNLVTMSEFQAGGVKGKATVDHILLMKEVITHLKNKRESIYLVFLDVTKAYDKAWLDAIMYVMHKQGLIDNTCGTCKETE